MIKNLFKQAAYNKQMYKINNNLKKYIKLLKDLHLIFNKII